MLRKTPLSNVPFCSLSLPLRLVVGHVQASFVIPAGATFEDYLRLTLPEDEISEIPLSLKAMQGGLKEKEKNTGLTPEEQVCQQKPYDVSDPLLVVF